MKSLTKATITLPRNAFLHSRPSQLHVKIGDRDDKLYEFMLNTKATFVVQRPVNNPSEYHFSMVNCMDPKFKDTHIISVYITSGRVSAILYRLPYEGKAEPDEGVSNAS